MADIGQIGVLRKYEVKRFLYLACLCMKNTVETVEFVLRGAMELCLPACGR